MRVARITFCLGLVALAAPTAAIAGHHRGTSHGSNMPAGFTWPPSAEMVAAGKQCLTQLDALGVTWQAGAATRRIPTPIEVPSLSLGGLTLEPTYRKGPFVMDCHLALALAESGPALSALGVRTLRFSTIHEYRRIRVRGRTGELPLSRHALGMAIDVFEFVLADGSKLVVARDYRRGNQTLRDIEAALAGNPDMRTPLTPGNAPGSHRDHFHLEARMLIGPSARPELATR